MKLFNYKAFSINTPLDSKSLIAADALEGFINDLLPEKTFYHGYYNLEKRGSFTKYEGILRPVFDTVHFDFDSHDGGTLALADTRKFCAKLDETNTSYEVYFSGNKGFHVAVHSSALGISEGPKDEIESLVKNVCHALKKDFPTLDTGIWNANRKFRAFRSKHEKSDLYKIRLTNAGIDSDLLNTMNITEIRNLAKNQQMISYKHPVNGSMVPWLNGSEIVKEARIYKKTNVVEIAQGQMLQDASIKFKNFKDKKCVEQMFDGTLLPQFNRHDIELCLIYECRMTGLTLDESLKKMNTWALKVFASEPDRVADCERQVRDSYTRDLTDDKMYLFGCYGEVKKAYCSAKCKIYNSLDNALRAEPLDANKAQKLENEVRRNPNLELSEGELADNILKEFGKPLIKSEGDFFTWEGTHWERGDRERASAMFYQMAAMAYQNKAPFAKIDSLVKQMKLKIPVAPETNYFFSSSPHKFNFTDGTAWVTQTDGKISIDFKPHSMEDYLGSCRPFPLYAESGLPTDGEELKAFFDVRLKDLGADGVRVLKQMLGAALIPFVPRIFFIEGVTNSGKSTMATLIQRLLGEHNTSKVLPIIRKDGSSRFNWEPAIGKIANIVLELPKGGELDVNTLKMVRDKATVSTDRKGKGHVNTTLPFLHIYCCNEMPKTFEGNTGALNNRVTLLYFKPGYMNGRAGIIELATHIWDLDAGSVLAAAREGLADLVESGFKYFEPESSKKAVNTWQNLQDSTAEYFEDLRSGEHELPFEIENRLYEKGAIFYANYVEWCKKSGRKALGKKTWYSDISKRLGVPRKNNAKGGERFDFSSLLNLSKDEAEALFDGENSSSNPTVILSERNPNLVSARNY